MHTNDGLTVCFDLTAFHHSSDLGTAGIEAGLAGLIHYQWTQRNITGVEGTSIGPIEVEENSASLDVESGTGVTPNDGYAIQETG